MSTFFVHCGALIELAAAIAVSYHVALALAAAIFRRDADRARLLIAKGVITALSFSVAGTLLKTLALQTWQQIGMFAFVLIFRTLLKRVFLWEERQIRAIQGRAGDTSG